MSVWVRVPLLGAGTLADPFRSPRIPNVMTLIRDDETPAGIGAPRWCLVEIPDADYEEPRAGEAVVTVNVPGIGLVIRQMALTHRLRWRDKLRRIYQERAAEYDPTPQ